MKPTDKISNVLKAVSCYKGASSKEDHQRLEPEVSYATVKRLLNKFLGENYLIREALGKACVLINTKQDLFKKAFLVLVLLSYIQPFNDGNKRTARILSKAVLLQSGYCPISFRTVDSLGYKKAMLIFYELNNVSAMKSIFMGQFAFAVKTYF